MCIHHGKYGNDKLPSLGSLNNWLSDWCLPPTLALFSYILHEQISMASELSLNKEFWRAIINKIWNEKVPKSLLWLKTSIVAWWLMESMVHEKFNLIKHSWWWNIMIYTKTKWFTKVSIIFFAYLLKLQSEIHKCH